MENFTLAEAADLLEVATIDNTADHGHAIVHSGTTEAGQRFVLVNDCTGASVISYPL